MVFTQYSGLHRGPESCSGHGTRKWSDATWFRICLGFLTSTAVKMFKAILPSFCVCVSSNVALPTWTIKSVQGLNMLLVNNLTNLEDTNSNNISLNPVAGCLYQCRKPVQYVRFTAYNIGTVYKTQHLTRPIEIKSILFPKRWQNIATRSQLNPSVQFVQFMGSVSSKSKQG